MALNGEAVESVLAACDLAQASAIVWPLEGAAAVSVRPDADLYPASMIKLPIAMALERLAASGRASLDDLTSVRPESVTVNDAPSPFVAGYEATLRACAEAMLSLSDNVATNALIDALGRDVITRECEALGLHGTSVRRKLSGALPLIVDPAATGRNAHPAADCARLLLRSGAMHARAAIGFTPRYSHNFGTTSYRAAGIRETPSPTRRATRTKLPMTAAS